MSANKRQSVCEGSEKGATIGGSRRNAFQYRELIPRLADQYRVIAPDLPGFGFTEVPEKRHYKYTFDASANTIPAFTDGLHLKRYALYVFDYGAPTGFRLAMARPERVIAIVSQTGNAYEEGLGDAWAPIQRYWRGPNERRMHNVDGIYRSLRWRLYKTLAVPAARGLRGRPLKSPPFRACRPSKATL